MSEPSAVSAAPIPRKFLRPFLLLALEHFPDSYGYELCERVRSHGLAVELAAVYRDLRAMEKHDLVTSTWEASESGPDRRVYSLTDEGESQAAAAHLELLSVRDALSDALGTFVAPARRGRR